MGHVERRRRIEASPDLVWELLTDPDLYAVVAPNLERVEVLSGSGEGMVRRCVDTDGNAWTESCTHWEDGREFAVAVDVADSEFHRRLFTRFEGRWALSTDPTDADGVVVTVAFDYDTRYGPLGRILSRYLAHRAPPLIEAIFDGWEAEIGSRLEVAGPSTGRQVASR